MGNRCTEFNSSEEHLRHCGECQRQMGAHTELVKFSSDLPSVQLSAGFNARLLQRLGQPARQEPASYVNLWLKSYWVLATTMSVIVLFRVQLSPGLDNLWLFPLSLVAIGSFALLAFLPARHAKRIAAFLGLAGS